MLDKKLKAPRALKEDMERSIATNRAGSKLDKPKPALDLKKWRDKKDTRLSNAVQGNVIWSQVHTQCTK